MIILKGTIVFCVAGFVGLLLWIRTQGEPGSSLSSAQMDQDVQSCARSGIAEQQCWEDVMEQYLRRFGVEGAFSFLVHLYDTQPSFGPVCHDLTHRIGERAYDLFARGVRVQVSPKTAYCSYGFYHGFMERLVTTNGDMKEAGDFCRDVDSQISTTSPDAIYQCFHGIGHGTVNNHDPSTWGDEQAMIGPALSFCEGTASTTEDLSRCATGVYNGLALFYINNEYNLVPRRDDPLWICRQQPESYQDACYISLNILLLTLAGQDIASAAVHIEKIPDDTMAAHAMINLMAPIGTKQLNSEDHSQYITLCRSVQERLRLACIQGYAYGFLENGPPGDEYVKPLQFCASDQLRSDEQEACDGYIFSYLPRWYSTETYRSICDSLSGVRKERCLTETVKARQTIGGSAL